MSSRVFLGGTCNNSQWREELKPKLKVDFFDPVVKDWTDAAYHRELHEREVCDHCLYVITPKMTGVYSIAEVVDDSNKRPEKTVFCVLPSDDGAEFNRTQWVSLAAVGKMVEKNGGKLCADLDEVAQYLNAE